MLPNKAEKTWSKNGFGNVASLCTFGSSTFQLRERGGEITHAETYERYKVELGALRESVIPHSKKPNLFKRNQRHLAEFTFQ